MAARTSTLTPPTLLLLALAIAVSAESLQPQPTECGQVQSSKRITGGKEAELGQFPWMALLGIKDEGKANGTFICGGTLINERYVLTAAHCFRDQYGQRINLTVVRLGEHNLTSPVDCQDGVCAPKPQDIGVEEVIESPHYNHNNKRHDIALVRLRRSVGAYSNYIRPICLPRGLNVSDGGNFDVAGWGKTTSSGQGSPVLMKAKVSGMEHDDCEVLLGRQNVSVGPGQLCAGGEEGRDVCNGDSGGPLMKVMKLTAPDATNDVSSEEADTSYEDQGQQLTYLVAYYQMGVVSFGLNLGGGAVCGGSGTGKATEYPSVYTRVSFYLPWIDRSLRP